MAIVFVQAKALCDKRHMNGSDQLVIDDRVPIKYIEILGQESSIYDLYEDTAADEFKTYYTNLIKKINYSRSTSP